MNIMLHLANCYFCKNALVHFVSQTKLFKIYGENSKYQKYSQHYMKTVQLALLSYHTDISKHFKHHIFFFTKNEKCFMYNDNTWPH